MPRNRDKQHHDDWGNCDDCKRRLPARLLDAVLLSEDESEASTEAYCERCWPRHKKIAHDEWRPICV